MMYLESLRGQEPSLEPSKAFYKGNKSSLTIFIINIRKSMKIYVNPLKSIKRIQKFPRIHENL